MTSKGKENKDVSATVNCQVSTSNMNLTVEEQNVTYTTADERNIYTIFILAVQDERNHNVSHSSVNM